MIWFRLGFANLCLSPLASLVTLLLISLSTASIALLLLVSSQLVQTLSRDARGIDLVLGARGSPLQLVLSAVYHADIPTGNILLSDTRRWSADSRISSAIPLSLGDSYRGFRIVGTTTDYSSIYSAILREGRYWRAPMEAVAGAAIAASTGVQIDSKITGAHGLSTDGRSHDAQAYRIVGILQPTGTVIDRLILTSLDSVWQLHDQSESHEVPGESAKNHGEDHSGDDHHSSDEKQIGNQNVAHGQQITAMLLSYRSPLAALSLPREVNAEGRLIAAAPAVEVARVLQLVGIGIDGMRAFTWVLIATAFLSLFAILYGSLRARRNDLAMLRCLGANRWELLYALLVEGLLIASAGLLLGVAVGHSVTELVARWLSSARGLSFTGWTWLPSEIYLLLSLLGVALIAAALPAVQAYRTDVARTLAQP